jgi:radical SAM protein with 4Fe4S-binding SPASM domain
LDEIKISIDGASKEEYERIRTPLRFDDVINNVIEFVRLRNERKSLLKIYVTCCSTSDKQATMQPLEKIVDGFSFTKIHNWGGSEADKCRGQVRKPCSRLWQTMTILANGDVSLCCLDYDGKHILGHIDENTTIKSVWNNEAYKTVRGWHKRGLQDKIPLCANCTKAFLY